MVPRMRRFFTSLFIILFFCGLPINEAESEDFTLSITLNGSGGGSLISIPSGTIECTYSPQAGTCSSTQPAATTLTFFAAPSADSFFGAWGGSCSSCNDLACMITLDSDKNCICTFTTVPPVRTGETSSGSSTTIQDAFDNAPDGAIIHSRAVFFHEELLTSRPVSLTLQGGYDTAFSANPGYSILYGGLVIGYGSLLVDRLIISEPQIEVPTPPLAPGQATLIPGDRQLTVNWAAVSGATSYQVWYSTTNDISTAIQFGQDITTTTCTITNLTNGITYYVWIRAKNGAGTSGFSVSASGTAVAPPVPYFAGYYGDGALRPCYWQGATRTSLSIPNTDVANAVAFSPVIFANTTVYAAGTYTVASTTRKIPCYWVGATRTDLSGGGTGNAYATGIAVNGDTVYTVGYYYDSNKNIPCFWTGTTRTDFDSSSFEGPWGGYATSVAVYNGTVYTAGYYYNGTRLIPCYWTGTTRTDLPGDGIHDAKVWSITVDNGIVYTAGNYYDGSKYVPCYWTETSRTDLPGDGTHDGRATSLFVSNGTVYTGGYYSNGNGNIACYWTETTRTDLQGYTGSHDVRIRAITVSGDTVYAAGSSWISPNGPLGCSWAGTTRKDLPFVPTEVISPDWLDTRTW